MVLRQPVRLDRPAQKINWMEHIPRAYSAVARGGESREGPREPAHDPACLAILESYRSLASMAREARKPIFHLQAADGALGSHAKAAEMARKDYERLAMHLARRTGLQAAP